MASSSKKSPNITKFIDNQDDLDTVDQATRDAVDLAALGHSQALTRKFDIWSMLALAFCVLGTYSTEAQGLSSGLTNGGPIAVLWGLAVVTLCNICVAVSMGELCSSMPTALGQAFWISQLSQTPLGRFTAYMCAWINTFGWWTLTASQNAFMTEFLLGMKVMFDPEWDGASKGWVQFLVYVGITVFFTAINHVGCRNDRFLPWFNNFVGVWYVGLFFIIGLALLISVGVKHDLKFQSAKFVFGTWINQTGWPDGVTWFMGLVQGAYGLTAFDSVIHMVEEIPAPRRNGPKTMYLSVICGAISGFIFMVICLFTIQNLDNVLDPPTGLPFVELLQETVGLNGAATLVALFIFNGMGQGVSVLTSSSRLTWSFARDGGIPFAAYFSYVDPTWQVPGRALWLQAFLISLVGVLYLFANTVLEAILSVSTIALTVSYAMPIIVLLLVGRDKLPPGEFRLGRLGTPLNVVSIVYCAITTVFFLFPGAPSPAPSDMNYAIAVFGVMLVAAVAFWFVKGRVSFMQMDDELVGQVVRELSFDEPNPQTLTAGDLK
ncbi:amino acid transporter-like protein [Trichoderma reesei QM6a]|jgi:amino acid transporter|uniref:Amino acid transporter-like protein n=2 Tax=Hypocrea jecorina TaxID=51453 RepID=G0RKM0_HYPJQ|nr:amino acid transporter-like protein [Trichoderma reesei QM6a]EGR48447.1 amino acid transporter-like protein [Trichoderma reesei QM6a]ETS07120.1 putative amino acid permease family protein [Trichoderma reesei RUT C-30]